MNTVQTPLAAFCETHWLRADALTPGQLARAERLVETGMGWVPEGLQGGLVRWVVKATPPGGFLQAVISNDLRQAFQRGDEDSRAGLGAVLAWLYNFAPALCHGRADALTVWPAAIAEPETANPGPQG